MKWTVTFIYFLMYNLQNELYNFLAVIKRYFPEVTFLGLVDSYDSI